MANHKHIEYVGDSRVPAKRVPNISPSYSEFPGKNEPFWPNFLLKEWMVGAVALTAFLILTVSHPSPLEAKADPTNTSFTPLPDWYFLFLYQLLKAPWASGSWVVLGTMVIPGLLFGGLFLAPFLDRGPERRASKRPLATAFMLLALASITFLTWQSVSTHDWAAAERQGKIVPKADIDTASEGYQIAKENTCITCHGDKFQGGAGAPSLIGTGLSADEVAKIAKSGKGKMPPGVFKGNDEQLKKLSEFISGLGKE